MDIAHVTLVSDDDENLIWRLGVLGEVWLGRSLVGKKVGWEEGWLGRRLAGKKVGWEEGWLGRRLRMF